MLGLNVTSAAFGWLGAASLGGYTMAQFGLWDVWSTCSLHWRDWRSTCAGRATDNRLKLLKRQSYGRATFDLLLRVRMAA